MFDGFSRVWFESYETKKHHCSLNTAKLSVAVCVGLFNTKKKFYICNKTAVQIIFGLKKEQLKIQ